VYVYLQSALSSIDDSEPNPRESNTSATQSTSQTGQVQLKKAKKRSMIVKDSFSRTAVVSAVVGIIGRLEADLIFLPV